MPDIGDPAPQFSAVDVITNQTYDLATYDGSVVLLIFSGPSWCGPCQFEAPILEELWQVFSQSASLPKVQFLMVSTGVQESPQAFKTAVENFGLTFPALLNPQQTISNLYQITGVPTLFCINTEQKICDIHGGAGPPADAVYAEIYSMLIGCGAAEPTNKTDLSKWAAVMTILFGVTQDGGGLGVTPGGKPIPIDPWGPLMRLSAEKKDLLTELAISELAKGLSDYRTAAEIERMALRGAEAAVKKLVAKNALLPRELDKTFSDNPRK
jgi:peroxiredoxin